VRKILLVLTFLMVVDHFLIGQTTAKVEAKVDTTEIRIGEQLNFTLQLKTDSLSLVEFPANPNFSSFEILEQSPLDTIRAQDHYTFTKKYALIQFDSGNFIIPQQAVFVNGFVQVSDSIPIRVNTVVVDTLEQKMYDIKPIIDLGRNYDQLIRILLYVLLGLFVLGGIINMYFFREKQKKLKELGLSPFEMALKDLKAIENQKLVLQKDYKVFYTELIYILRKYLDKEIQIDALESTSRELLAKLNQLQKDNTLSIHQELIANLEGTLDNADMVKFAQMRLDKEIAIKDKQFIQSVVIKIKEAIPEPSEEELKQNQAFQFLLNRKKKRQRIIFGLSSLVGIVLVALTVLMLIYGYYPVRDTILGYPTKKMMHSDWIQSQYGSPPVSLMTPQVLIRQKSSKKDQSIFEFGTVGYRFYIGLQFSPFDQTDPTNQAQDSIGQLSGEVFVKKVADEIQRMGGTNIFIDGQQVTLPKGDQAISIEGRFDYTPINEIRESRYDFTVILVLLEGREIELKLIYPTDDRYASKIKDRIVEGIEIITEL